MHLVLVTGITSYLKVHITFLSHAYCFSPLWTQKEFEGRYHLLRYKLLGGRDLSLVFPILSSTTDYTQYRPSKNVCGKQWKNTWVREGRKERECHKR